MKIKYNSLPYCLLIYSGSVGFIVALMLISKGMGLGPNWGIVIIAFTMLVVLTLDRWLEQRLAETPDLKAEHDRKMRQLVDRHFEENAEEIRQAIGLYFDEVNEFERMVEVKRESLKEREQALRDLHTKPKDEFFSRDLIKVISTDFYRWWHNQPGANTDQGFDSFWQEHKHKYLEGEVDGG